MPNIVHLTVGGPEWTPTSQELLDLVSRFHKEKVFVNGPLVVPTHIHIPEDGLSRAKLVISAGDADWNPTTEEIDALRTLFTNAMLDPCSRVVATRDSVYVQVIQHP